MPTLVIDNVPKPLFDRIQQLAQQRQRTPEAAVLEVLESALPATVTLSEPRLPQEPFLTEEICAPCSLPRPEGTLVQAIHVDPPWPTPHDLPDGE
jgi:hypothetical protein